MSHNQHATQPTDRRRTLRISPSRQCSCPNRVHEHGCISRYRDYQPTLRCRCDQCRRAACYVRAAQEGRRPAFDVDWVNVDRLTAGQPVHATPAEVEAAILWLTDRGYSARAIQRHLAIPVTCRRVTRARARARLEVAA